MEEFGEQFPWHEGLEVSLIHLCFSEGRRYEDSAEAPAHCHSRAPTEGWWWWRGVRCQQVAFFLNTHTQNTHLFWLAVGGFVWRVHGNFLDAWRFYRNQFYTSEPISESDLFRMLFNLSWSLNKYDHIGLFVIYNKNYIVQLMQIITFCP